MSTEQTTVFICNRGGQAPDTVKVQLELPRWIIEAYKEKSKEFQGGKYTAKQVMENILKNNIEGVSANG